MQMWNFWVSLLIFNYEYEHHNRSPASLASCQQSWKECACCCWEAGGWIGMLKWLIEVMGVIYKKKYEFCYKLELYSDCTSMATWVPNLDDFNNLPWEITANDFQPAYLQPRDPDGSKWKAAACFARALTLATFTWTQIIGMKDQSH